MGNMRLLVTSFSFFLDRLKIYIFSSQYWPVSSYKERFQIICVHWTSKILICKYFFMWFLTYCTWIRIRTVCPRSSDPFNIVTYYIKWVTTSWTYSTLILIIFNILFKHNHSLLVRKIEVSPPQKTKKSGIEKRDRERYKVAEIKEKRSY